MSDSPQLPGIDKPTETYLDAWEHFDNEVFDVEELHTEMLRESTEPERIPNKDTINSRLARGAVAGIIGSYGDRRYNIRVDPEADDERWNEVAVDHADRVKDEITSAYQERAAASDEQEQQGEQFITHDGNAYLRTFVGHNTDVKDDLEGYLQATFNPKEHTGIVLESWTNVAEAASNLKDELCDDKQMNDISFLYRFVADDEELTEDEEGDSVFRVYLSETRFSE